MKKKQIHGEGRPVGELFLERMVEAGRGIADYFGPRVTYISVVKNISVDASCHPLPDHVNQAEVRSYGWGT